MARRQMRVPHSTRQHQRRVLPHHRIRFVVAANPKLVLPFLVPTQRTRSSVEFNLQPILMARQHLANRQAALGTVIEANQHAGQVFSTYFDRCTLCGVLLAERFCRPTRGVPCLYHRRQVRKHRCNLSIRNVLCQVTPVRPDISQSRTGATLRRIRAPRIHVSVRHPVLQILPMNKEDIPNIVALRHQARLLYQRIAPIVKSHRIGHASRRSRIAQNATLFGADR